jgi:ribonuclease Y
MIVIAIVGAGIGFWGGYYYYRQISGQKIKSAETQAEDIVAKAEARSKELKVQSKEEAIRLRSEGEAELGRKRQELDRQEERLHKRQESLDQRYENLERKERTLNKRQSQLDRRTNEIEKLNEQRLEELERVSGLTSDEAKDELLKMVEQDARQDMARILRQVETRSRSQRTRDCRVSHPTYRL